jgi:predicted metalloprotease with PDZ domain
VERAVAEVAGVSLGPFLERTLRAREELDYAPALAHLGLRFRDRRAGLPPDTPSTWLGIQTHPRNGGLFVSTVRADGPAHDSGIAAGDEILAVGGFRVTKETLSSRLAQYEPGERVEVLVARREAIRILPVTLAAHPGLPWRLEVDPEAPAAAARSREAWWARSGPRS